MSGLISRYRAYLSTKSGPLDGGPELIGEARWQLLPWLAPPLAPTGLCALLHAPYAICMWTLVGGVCVSAIGSSLVIWEFIAIPLRNDFRGAQGKGDTE
jgi:hypothetical protein